MLKWRSSQERGPPATLWNYRRFSYACWPVGQKPRA
jgi:hypothetical protein